MAKRSGGGHGRTDFEGPAFAPAAAMLVWSRADPIARIKAAPLPAAVGVLAALVAMAAAADDDEPPAGIWLHPDGAVQVSVEPAVFRIRGPQWWSRNSDDFGNHFERSMWICDAHSNVALSNGANTPKYASTLPGSFS